jgi:hypothetical protein
VKSAGEPNAGDQHVQTQAAVETAPTAIDQPDREALFKRGQELIAAGKPAATVALKPDREAQLKYGQELIAAGKIFQARVVLNTRGTKDGSGGGKRARSFGAWHDL